MALETTLKAYLVTYWQEDGRTAVNYSKLDASFDPEKLNEDPMQISWALDDIVTLFMSQSVTAIRGNAKEFHSVAGPRLKAKGILVPEAGRESYFFMEISDLSARSDMAASVARKMVIRYADKINSSN